MGQLAAFIVLSALTLVAAVVVVGSGNIVRSALSLVPAFLGITGIYISKIFDETKKRPLYIVRRTTFGDR